MVEYRHVQQDLTLPSKEFSSLASYCCAHSLLSIFAGRPAILKEVRLDSPKEHKSKCVEYTYYLKICCICNMSVLYVIYKNYFRANTLINIFAYCMIYTCTCYFMLLARNFLLVGL